VLSISFQNFGRRTGVAIEVLRGVTSRKTGACKPYARANANLGRSRAVHLANYLKCTSPKNSKTLKKEYTIPVGELLSLDRRCWNRQRYIISSESVRFS
jgi:hypothetical protein